MSTGRTRTAGLLLTCALSGALLSIHYGDILRSPNHHMFNTEGDGLKNYFSFAWHVRHDTSAFSFTGMNAPYGEHINYPDAQPLVSNAWRAVAAVWPGAADLSVGLENLLMLLSPLLCAVFLFLLLRRFDVAWWYAAPAAVAIAFLSMQMLRSSQAHYALAYGWCLPSMLWLALRHLGSARPWRSSALLFIALSCWLWTHVYLGFIAAAWLSLQALFAPRGTGMARRATLFLPAVLALVVFQLVIALTDPHVGRTGHPTGFFDYQTSWTMLSRPDLLWSAPWSMWTTERPTGLEPECWSYLGLANIIAVVPVAMVPVLRLFRRNRTAVAAPGGSLAPLLAAWAASIVLLLFAFGLPFKWGAEEMLGDVPVFRQFRAPARFSWAFYFGSSLVAVVFGWHLFRAARRTWAKALGGVCLAGYLLIMGSEGWYLNAYNAGEITRSPNLFDREQLPEDLAALLEKARGVDARAIGSLPYFHNGGEELMVPGDGPGLLAGQVLAYHLGIPMASSSLTRTGLEEVRAGISAFGPDIYPRAMPAGWKDADTLFLLVSGTPLGPYDEAILRRATLFAEAGEYKLATIRAGELLRDGRAEWIGRFKSGRDGLYQSGAWLFSEPDTFLFHDAFEGTPAHRAYHGRGAYSGLKRDFNVIAELPDGSLEPGEHYIASLWYYNRGPMRCHTWVAIDEADPATGQAWWDHYTDARFARTLDGDWSLVELPFTVKARENRVKLLITGQPWYRDSIWVDEVLVRKAAVDVYRPDSIAGAIWYNGHRIGP